MSSGSAATAPVLDVAAARARCEQSQWEETWKPIDNCDGYDVSDFGNVRSHWLRGNRKGGRQRNTHPRTLAKRARPDGAYPSVSLPVSPTGNYVSKAIHRLVAAAFIGPCPEGHEVAHLNGDPTDNRAVNLAYVTHVENERHKRQHGTDGVGERNSCAKFQGWQIAEIKFLAAKGVPPAKISALFDLSHKYVSEILAGRVWRDQAARTDLVAALDALDRVLALAAKYDSEGYGLWAGELRAAVGGVR